MKLFIDYIRQAPDDSWQIARTVCEAKHYLGSGKVTEVSFDHDLGDVDEKMIHQEKTGYDAAKYLVDYCLDNSLTLPNFFVHSQNDVGNENITKLLLNFKKFQQK
jgi:hypothetical protein